MDALPSQCKLRRHLSGDTMIFVYLWHLDLLDFSEWAEDKLDILLRDAVGQTSDVHATCCDQTIEVTVRSQIVRHNVRKHKNCLKLACFKKLCAMCSQ
eukprot:8773062-Pyramimonas_sp.AAC.2